MRGQHQGGLWLVYRKVPSATKQIAADAKLPPHPAANGAGRRELFMIKSKQVMPYTITRERLLEDLRTAYADASRRLMLAVPAFAKYGVFDMEYRRFFSL